MIDIVIPSFNQQDYLPDAIDSALAQEGVGRIIVVDDGSTDNSLKIAQNYNIAFPQVQVISQTNKGLASARNTGIMNSKADYILFLDADDILLDGCTEKIIDTFAKTGADVVSPSFKTFGTSSDEIVLMPNPTLEDFRTGNRVGTCSAVKRSVLLEVGGYSPRMVEGYEDLHLWVNLLAKGKKIVTIPEVLWLYRTKEVSMYTKITPTIHKKLIQQINTDVPEAQLNF